MFDSSQTDYELHSAWRGGDRAAGGELMRRHMAPLRRFFARRAPPPPDDLLQLTLLACVEQRDRYRGAASFQSYLFAIARNVLCNELRRRRRDPITITIEAEALPAHGASPCEVLAGAERRCFLLQSLQLVAMEYQEVLALSIEKNLTCRELAAVLGINENTARSRLVRGRAAVTRALLRS